MLTSSVIIPTCDREERLKKAVNSVLAQTRPVDEIIIVDNGINAIKKDHLPQHSKVKIIRGLPRFGVAQARNTGIINSTSDIILFLDDDDYWDSNYVSIIMKQFENGRADILLGDLLKDAPESRVSKHSHFKNEEELTQKILKKNPSVGGSNTAIKKSLLTKSKGFDPSIPCGEDCALVLELILQGATCKRATGANVFRRSDEISSNLSTIASRIEERKHFMRNYWGIMHTKTRITNLYRLFSLCLKKSRRYLKSLLRIQT